MADTIQLADYLFARLHQLGIRSVFGVPGDYNLTLLDHVEPAGLQWVGNCNELNAGYAADAYSRIKGLGAMVTTFGVGELSAINAIAGAYTERAPVVHIVGTPPRSSQDSRALVHHTLLDGDYWKFAHMAINVTAAQANLKDPRVCPEQIDTVLEQCLVHSRPVYISIPTDLVAAPVFAGRLKTPISIPPATHPKEEESAISQILDRIHTCQRPMILVDGESRALGILKEVEEFVETTNWPTWTSAFGKSLIDETLPNVYGIYEGPAGKKEYKDYVDSCDLVICFGPHFSSTNTYAFSTVPKSELAVSFTPTAVHTGKETFRDLPAKYLLSKLLQKIDRSKLSISNFEQESTAFNGSKGSTPSTKNSDLVDQKHFYQQIHPIFGPGDIILGETGTAGYGIRELKLPKHSRLFTPATWLSIGYMLPATLGAAIAQRELIAAGEWHGLNDAKTVLLIGDGSLQMTVQELSTIIHQKLDVTIIVVNNDGYTIERCIHGRKQHYNDINMWRYLQAPGFFGASEKGENSAVTFEIRTWADVEKVLGDDRLKRKNCLKMIEVMMEREDAPAVLLALMERQIQREKEEQGANGH